MFVCSSTTVVYYISTAIVYGCIAAIVIMALVLGTRARRNVKHERVKHLPKGFSPLDVQRILIGKTYPRRLTKALIAHWANNGYIKIKRIDGTHVAVQQLKDMPEHDSGDAVFFDRGTYVRERELYCKFIEKIEANDTVSLNLPLFSIDFVKKLNKTFAAREDEGVYTERHYRLKLLTTALSVIPIFAVALFFCFADSPAAIILPLLAVLGLFVLRFMREIPVLFRMIWSSLWLLAPIGFFINDGIKVGDPFGMTIAASAILFLGTFVLIRFVDYREKKNLAEYSDIINYRRFLLFARRDEFVGVEYAEALPYLHEFHIKPLVKRKFVIDSAPDWYSGEKGGALL